MITQFKIYEKFSSKLLVTSIYNFLYKVFSDSDYTVKKTYNNIEILNDEEYRIRKYSTGYYTGRIYTYIDGSYIYILSYNEIAINILNFLKSILDKYNINCTYEFDDDHNQSFLIFDIKDYNNDKVISIIDNCSTDELEAYITSKKYNL